MPGHFTHIYTARRVADLLAERGVRRLADLGDGGDAVRSTTRSTAGRSCGTGRSSPRSARSAPTSSSSRRTTTATSVGPHTDQIMLGARDVLLLRRGEGGRLGAAADHPRGGQRDDGRDASGSCIKLQQIWDDFVDAWNKTIGPLVDAASEIARRPDRRPDQPVPGRARRAAGRAQDRSARRSCSTFTDIFGGLTNTVVQKGWQEDSFLWSDMTHYRRTSAICQALVRQAEALRDGTDDGE